MHKTLDEQATELIAYHQKNIMQKTLDEQATELIAYHQKLKEAGMASGLIHELVAIAARGIANNG